MAQRLGTTRSKAALDLAISKVTASAEANAILESALQWHRLKMSTKPLISTFQTRTFRMSPVRVIDRDGTDLGVMIVAEAQKLASEQGAELFVTAHTAKPPVVRIVIVRKAKME